MNVMLGIKGIDSAIILYFTDIAVLFFASHVGILSGEMRCNSLKKLYRILLLRNPLMYVNEGPH